MRGVERERRLRARVWGRCRVMLRRVLISYRKAPKSYFGVAVKGSRKELGVRDVFGSMGVVSSYRVTQDGEDCG